VFELNSKMKKSVAEVMPAVVGTRRKDGTRRTLAAGYRYRGSWSKHRTRMAPSTLTLCRCGIPANLTTTAIIHDLA
jgi:hypothetical protein